MSDISHALDRRITANTLVGRSNGFGGQLMYASRRRESAPISRGIRRDDVLPKLGGLIDSSSE